MTDNEWEILKQVREYNRILGERERVEILSTSNLFIINSLKKCEVDWPTIFGLVWGEKMIDSEEFPLELRTIVANIYYREEGKEEYLDPLEKKLHSIITDLLCVLYEKQVNDIVERAKEPAKLYK